MPKSPKPKTKKEVKCEPCEEAKKKDIFSLKKTKEYLSKIKGWESIKRGKAIQKEFKFPDFVKAMSFVDQVADVAEGAGHHPDIFISYNLVRLELSTHSIGGLTENDFLVAAEINKLWLIRTV